MTQRLRIVCASANAAKVAEIQAILSDEVVLLPRPADIPDVVEDADTFEGNARLKAVAICEATGLAAVADDTGLEVDALRGEPGVYSARWSGEGSTAAANRTKMVRELTGIADRRAAFRTCVVLRWPHGAEIVVEGTCSGTIAEAERGDGGFGYDSLFVPDDSDGRTFAEMSASEKHAISHRGRAFRALVDALSVRPEP